MNAEADQDRSMIDARPTKELFISMLTRDITLRDAIGDLLDNSVDGALVLQPKGTTERDYSGLWVNLTFSAEDDYFKIEDNCGGISVEVARDYAFRFGRPANAPLTLGSVGYFGVGMKRALFKLGKKFRVESTTADSYFVMVVDVEQWGNEGGEDAGNWHFKFDEFREGENNPEEKWGTKITVTDLLPDVKATLELENEVNTLRNELEREHLYNIHRGLKVTLNNAELKAKALKLLVSDEFKTAYWKREDLFLRVEIYAGISERAGIDGEGGWYVFCNDRLILGPDTTETTGWGINSPRKIPRYHTQFDRFRGYVFFEADDPQYLPWNTTKNDLDEDSPRYKTVRQQMILLMRSVIDFLNALDNEREYIDKGLIYEEPLQTAIDNAKSVPLKEVSSSSVHISLEKFLHPEPLKPQTAPTKDVVWIRYHISNDELEAIREYFGEDIRVGELGRKTFDYFYGREIEG